MGISKNALLFLIALVALTGCNRNLPEKLVAELEGEVGVLKAGGGTYTLTEQVSILADPAGQYTIEEIVQGSTQQPFTPYLTYPESIEPYQWYWGKVQLKNALPPGQQHLEWVFQFSVTWSQLEVYTQQQDGSWAGEANGIFLPFNEKKFAPTAKAIFSKMHLPPGEVTTIYFRGKSERMSLPPSFRLQLEDLTTFYDKLSNSRVGNAIFIGFLTMMLLYNLIVYFFGRDRSSIYYSGYLLMMIIYSAYSYDDLVDWFGGVFFARNLEYYGFFKLSIFIGLSCYVAFIRKFVNLKELLPNWDRYFRLLSFLGLPLLFLYTFLIVWSNYSFAIEDLVAVPYIGLVILSCCALLYPLYTTGDTKAFFIFAGITAISIGAILTLLTRLYFAPFTITYLKAGVVAEVLIFSLGLAYHQREQVKARERADFALRESQLIQEKQQFEADRLQELNDFKEQFYTNITHELRTPLTVILGMNDQIEGHTLEKDLIDRNGKNLLNLINQLLELSKLESGHIRISWTYGDIISYLNYLVESFHSAAAQKNIQYSFSADQAALFMDYDEEKVLQIFNNLISNALKFTPEGGLISIRARQVSHKQQAILQLEVADNGIGIPSEQLPLIFDRFYRVTHAEHTTGSGVGLALTQELVHLMGGEITTISQPGKGTTFTVRLPIKQEYAPREATPPLLEVVATADPTANNEVDERPEILVIDDSPDIVTYLASLLSTTYVFHTATNGADGILKAKQLLPDIIISDVMMPQKNGYEVTEAIKTDEHTCHIPIILLTAKYTQEAKIEGLQHGADAYLTKPFNKEELYVRLATLIENRQKIQANYAKKYAGGITAEEGSADATEDPFTLKLHQLIEAALDDTAFGVNELAQSAHLSQMQLYRKLKATTGKTPSQFIRSYRLGRGLAMLKEGQLNVSEVAYSVGFSDPSYFSRTFSEEFNQRPSHFVNLK